MTTDSNNLKAAAERTLGTLPVGLFAPAHLTPRQSAASLAATGSPRS